MRDDVIGFDTIGPAETAIVGGKAAHLAALSRLEGIEVPAGFCVTTAAFRRVLADVPSLPGHLDRLSRLGSGDTAALRSLTAEIRRTIEQIAFPDDLHAGITDWVAGLGEDSGYAVRSSATSEDLPTASSAGLQDTFLNVVGAAAVLRAVRRSWASLFSERAVTDRLRHGLDHGQVEMAVVVQRRSSRRRPASSSRPTR